ncbi:hypothetical protein QCBJ_00450 [Pseudomonas sp. QC2]|nr:hypothetical protein QCBJ_00450 [Pseudomonas sp. QC2]
MPPRQPCEVIGVSVNEFIPVGLKYLCIRQHASDATNDRIRITDIKELKSSSRPYQGLAIKGEVFDRMECIVDQISDSFIQSIYTAFNELSRLRL